MARRRLELAIAAALLGGCAISSSDLSGSRYAEREPLPPAIQRALNGLTSPELARFESEAEFRAYLREMEQIIRRREGSRRDESDRIVVTGSRIVRPAPITNTQTAGVDEGDVVKKIGSYLLILQDGRIFSVDMENRLALADRVDVYRDPQGGAWYDEMLVYGDRVVVTAYSFDEEATEISVFRLDQANGRLQREGVFLISSDDYYDPENYATRLVGDRLVVYTSYNLTQFFGREWPATIRRWLPEAERDDRLAAGAAPLFDARGIHWPVQPVLYPVVHSVAICPFGEWRDGAQLECETTAFVGPNQSEMFVSPEDIFLWTWDDPAWARCGAATQAARGAAPPAALFRIPLDGGNPGVAGVDGSPIDQFSMDSRDGEFRALADVSPDYCSGLPLAYTRVPHARFTSTFARVAEDSFTPMPDAGSGWIENRFVDGWLVYGGREDVWPPAHANSGGRLVVAPVQRPADAYVLDIPHNVVRLEPLGGGILVNGYRDESGLDLTLVRLEAPPAIGAAARLDGRFESEGRSHAFNSAALEGGGLLMGLPTTPSADDADTPPWRSEFSDMSFLSLEAGGVFAGAGTIPVAPAYFDEDGWPATPPDYVCEVSCIDWYGNSRPIFADGRIFALLGLELVEVRLEGERVVEIARIDLTRS